MSFTRFKYNTLVFISVMRIVLTFVLPLYAVYRFVQQMPVYRRKGISSEEIMIYVGLLAAWCIIKVINHAIVRKEEQLRNLMEFDDRGLHKKFNSLQKLSRAEREAIAKQKIADMERLIGTGTLNKMTKQGSTDPEKDLKTLVGLQEVKNDISEFAARMEFDQKIKSKNAMISSMHMCFIGPPGTGKTSCAKIMTGFLHKYGYIKENKYIETDGNFLRGQTQGETSEKTSLLLSLSKGKVLFIDEAYALFSGHSAQEAIATIIKAMEDNRDDFVLILAGYEMEMKQLINANPGFFSRIGHIMYFGNYTDADLYNIFKHMARQFGFSVDSSAKQPFVKRIREEKEQPNFGNARTCRNILDDCISKHALNIKNGVLPKSHMRTICGEDIKDHKPQIIF